MSAKSPVSEITEEGYRDALEVLPPENWNHLPGGGEFFQMSEWYSGTVTTYYAARGGKFFKFRDDAWLSGKDVLDKVSKYLAEHSSPENLPVC